MRRALVTITLGLLTGCSSATGSHVASGAESLALVTDTGGLGDKSFNDSAYRGLVHARDALGASIEVQESKSAADYAPNLTALADGNFDEIYAIGFLMNDDVTEVAKNYPNEHFAIVDAINPEPNVVSLVFREQDGSFLAGALAAMVTKTKTIGFLGGIDSPLIRKFEAGYAAGAREVDPHVKVLDKYVGSFVDVASGKELAGVMFDAGADIVYVAAGKAGLGAIDDVRGRAGDYIIGVDSDEDAIAPGKILTSMVKHVDVAVYDVAADIRAHKRPTGTIEFGLKDDGVGLTDFTYTRAVVGAAHIARLKAIRAAILAGTIVPPKTREELAAFRPVLLKSGR